MTRIWNVISLLCLCGQLMITPVQPFASWLVERESQCWVELSTDEVIMGSFIKSVASSSHPDIALVVAREGQDLEPSSAQLGGKGGKGGGGAVYAYHRDGDTLQIRLHTPKRIPGKGDLQYVVDIVRAEDPPPGSSLPEQPPPPARFVPNLGCDGLRSTSKFHHGVLELEIDAFNADNAREDEGVITLIAGWSTGYQAVTLTHPITLVPAEDDATDVDMAGVPDGKDMADVPDVTVNNEIIVNITDIADMSLTKRKLSDMADISLTKRKLSADMEEFLPETLSTDDLPVPVPPPTKSITKSGDEKDKDIPVLATSIVDEEENLNADAEHGKAKQNVLTEMQSDETNPPTAAPSAADKEVPVIDTLIVENGKEWEKNLQNNAVRNDVESASNSNIPSANSKKTIGSDANTSRSTEPSANSKEKVVSEHATSNSATETLKTSNTDEKTTLTKENMVKEKKGTLNKGMAVKDLKATVSKQTKDKKIVLTHHKEEHVDLRRRNRRKEQTNKVHIMKEQINALNDPKIIEKQEQRRRKFSGDSKRRNQYVDDDPSAAARHKSRSTSSTDDDHAPLQNFRTEYERHDFGSVQFSLERYGYACVLYLGFLALIVSYAGKASRGQDKRRL